MAALVVMDFVLIQMARKYSIIGVNDILEKNENFDEDNFDF